VLLPAPSRLAGLTYNPPRIVARPPNAALRGPAGSTVTAWAAGLAGGRALAVAPDGDVFVAEPRAGRVSLLRDRDGDGAADADRPVWDENLRQPFGLAFHPGGWLYVGCTDRIVRYRYRPGQTRREAPPERVLDLPGGGYNQHWTRSVALSPDGAQVFASVGSETNDDVEADARRAAVLVAAADGSGARVFASGLRNPVWIAFHPDARRLYAVVNERDGLGDDLVPDYLTEVREGAFYGWPYSYFGAHVDPRHAGERPDLVRRAVVPDLPLGAHVAAVGLLFPTRGALGVPRGDALVSLHGSWNRSQRVGYKVIRARFAGGRPTGAVEDFITGWVLPDDRVWGRPVGLAELPDGSVLVADDESNTVWRVAR
jgi:glucose/arabinose dehydrogenase